MKIIAIVLGLIIIVGGGWLFLQSTKESPPTLPGVNQPAQNGTDQGGAQSTMPAIETLSVMYNDSEFSPAAVTVGVGSTITWKNASKVKMWVASAMHPAHTVYNSTSLSEHCKNGAPMSTEIFDQCVGIEPGGEWSFTFTKPGEWKYHDHITSGRCGSVNVVSGGPMVTDDANAAH